MSATWHADDQFWETFAPAMFPPERIANASGEVGHIIALTGMQPGATVLDSCCGPGRHSLEFARHGYQVTGVDRTANYLQQAQSAAVAEQLTAEFVEADMRQFRRGHSFDLALNLFTSFGYFEEPADDRAMLQNIFDSLRPGGALVLDLMGKEVLARKFEPRRWHELADGAIMLEERRIEGGWDWLANRWILIRDGRRSEFQMGHRLYSATELSALLCAVGFVSPVAYGDFEQAPYDHTADRLVLVARKA